MKKFLLFAVMTSAVISVNAALPERTVGHGIKTLKSTEQRAVMHRAKQRAAAEDATGIAVPFKHTLGKNTEVNDYVVIDTNGDGRTWKPGGFTGYSVCMAPNAEGFDAADDWMISPAVHLEAGQYYTVSYEEDMTLNKIEDKLGLYAGTAQTAEAMTMTVVAEHAYGYSNKVFTKQEAQFSVPETGNYYFGFHCTSEKATSGTPKVCNFAIELCENPVVVPDVYVNVPFTHTLGKNTEVNDYKIIDADNDTRTWKPGGFTGYSVCMKPNDAAVSANDDWMISLPVHLLPGVNYTLSYEAGMSLASGSEDIVGVYYGTEPEVNAMTQTVVQPHAVTKKDFSEYKTDFNVAREGYYYFGFHCTSEKDKSGNLKLCNFSIAESHEEIAPAAAGVLEITPAPMGELKATVKYTAPTVDVNGNQLSQLTKVIVTTNWGFKTEFTDVVPGGEYTFETTGVYNNAYNRFEGVAYIGDVAGEPVLVTDMFFGLDNPKPLTGVKAVLSDDFNTVTLTWNPVEPVGENGGFVDVSKVTYYVFDAFGSYYDPALLVTTETSATFDYSGVSVQDFVAYQVTAGIDELYYSLDTSSNIVTIGQPEKLPFYESFADGKYAQIWVVDLESQGNVMNGTVYDNELQTNADADEGVEPEYLNSHDGDNGFFLFMPIDINSAYGFSSAKISLAGSENPVLEFYYQGKGSALDIKVGADGDELQVVKTLDLKDNPTDGWTLARVDLTPYKSAKYVQVGVLMRAIHNTDESIWSVPFDNLRVIDLKDEALRVAVAKVPDAVKAGENIAVTMTLENIGTKALENACVAMSVDGVDAEPFAIADFAPGKVATINTSVATSVLSDDVINLTLTAMTDAKTAAESVEKTVMVEFPVLPMPTELAASVDDKTVMLTWQAPEFSDLTSAKEVFEDFDNPDYEMFTYDGFAGFTFVDLDGADNYSFLRDVNNPYRSEPMAYQLFDPVAAGVPEEWLVDCPTHSGNAMLVAWSCEGQNGNLLISPELTGEAQTISFWGRGFTIGAGMNETFSVWVSFTDTAIKSFTQVHDVENYPESGVVPEEWTEYKATLPEGAKYFAILHDAYDSYALFLDDFTFEAGGVLPHDTKIEGYNVYCDNALLCDADAAAAAHNPASDGTYNYRVSAVYNHGESRATVPVEVEFDGFANVGVESAQIAPDTTISCEQRTVTVNAPEGTPISIVDLGGRIIASGTGTLSATIAGDNVVIVAAGAHIAKVTLK